MAYNLGRALTRRPVRAAFRFLRRRLQGFVRWRPAQPAIPDRSEITFDQPRSSAIPGGPRW